MTWIGVIRSHQSKHQRDESWSTSLWQTFFVLTMGAQIPDIVSLRLEEISTWSSGDHVSNCTSHSGNKESYDWVVEQLTDLIHTTHKGVVGCGLCETGQLKVCHTLYASMSSSLTTKTISPWLSQVTPTLVSNWLPLKFPLVITNLCVDSVWIKFLPSFLCENISNFRSTLLVIKINFSEYGL
jgi:hypothetical protein